jgi:hypothetical protein
MRMTRPGRNVGVLAVFLAAIIVALVVMALFAYA